MLHLVRVTCCWRAMFCNVVLHSLLSSRDEHGQDQDWISCGILAIFSNHDWIWIFIFEKNCIRTGSGYWSDSITNFSWLRVIQDVTNDGGSIFFLVLVAVFSFCYYWFLYCQYVLHSSKSMVVRVTSSLTFSDQVEVVSCSYITSMLQRWPESLFQTPTPLLFQNFWIRIRQFFKFENPTPVQTPARIINPTVTYPCFYSRNDHTDSCYCRNRKVTPDPVFPTFLSLGPDPGPKEKRRILPESTPALLIRSHRWYAALFVLLNGICVCCVV